MARGMNKVMLIGRVGEEPKVTALQNGTVANFSFATSDSYIDAQGNKQEKTEWHRLTAWGKTAEIVQKYIHKGDCLYVEGKIQYREYEKNGEKRYATDIVIHELNMLSERKENAGNGNAYQNAPRNNAPVQNNVYNRAQAKPQQAYNTPMQNAQPQPQPQQVYGGAPVMNNPQAQQFINNNFVPQAQPQVQNVNNDELPF